MVLPVLVHGHPESSKGGDEPFRPLDPLGQLGGNRLQMFIEMPVFPGHPGRDEPAVPRPKPQYSLLELPRQPGQLPKGERQGR